MAKISRWSVTLQEHQGFHLFSEIILLFFYFLVTGGLNVWRTNLDQKNMITTHFAMPLVYFHRSWPLNHNSQAK